MAVAFGCPARYNWEWGRAAANRAAVGLTFSAASRSVRVGGNPEICENFVCAVFPVHHARNSCASAACFVLRSIINGTVEPNVTGPAEPTGTWAIPRSIPAFLNPSAAQGPLI